MHIKEALYLLSLKTYLIDGKSELILDDKYVLKIEAIEDFKWQNYFGELRPVCTITFLVAIINKDKKYQVAYIKKTRRNLVRILNSSIEEKKEFIFRKKKAVFSGLDCKVLEGNLFVPANLKKNILKRLSSELKLLDTELDKNKKQLIRKK